MSSTKKTTRRQAQAPAFQEPTSHQPAPEAAPEATESPQITLVDLQNALRIIDVAAERGAFKGPELTSVGQVRDKVHAFLEAAMPPEESQD